MRKEFILPIVLVIIIIPALLFLRKSFPAVQNKQQTVSSSPTETIQSKTEFPLIGTIWQWNQTKNADGTTSTPPDPSKFRMELREKNMTSTTDCNSVNADYIVDHEVLSFGSIISTKMYCDESLENLYTQSFPLVTSYTIENDTLTLILIKDMGTMLFSAVK